MLTRILLADDNADFRRMARRLLGTRDDLEICGEASSGSEAVNVARATNPDIALIDISMPGGNGIEAGRQIRQDHPDTLILAMSVYQPEMFISRVKNVGFHGFISKSTFSAELIPAIEAVLFGESYFRASTDRNN
jgi:DNA-binding NarL/FixJ family response regulator